MDSIRFLYHQAKPVLEAETIAFFDDREKTQNQAKIGFDYYLGGSLMQGREYKSYECRFGFQGQEFEEIDLALFRLFTAKSFIGYNSNPYTNYWGLL